MTDEQKAAYVKAQAVAAEIELESMLVTNIERFHKNEAPAYSELAFKQLIERYCIGHNAVIGLFNT